MQQSKGQFELKKHVAFRFAAVPNLEAKSAISVLSPSIAVSRSNSVFLRVSVKSVNRSSTTAPRSCDKHGSIDIKTKRVISN